MQHEDAENIGYIIPPPVIQHFITDFERNGKYTAFPVLGIEWQKMESPFMRKALGMQVHLELHHCLVISEGAKREPRIQLSGCISISSAFGCQVLHAGGHQCKDILSSCGNIADMAPVRRERTRGSFLHRVDIGWEEGGVHQKSGAHIPCQQRAQGG